MANLKLMIAILVITQLTNSTTLKGKYTSKDLTNIPTLEPEYYDSDNRADKSARSAGTSDDQNTSEVTESSEGVANSALDLASSRIIYAELVPINTTIAPQTEGNTESITTPAPSVETRQTPTTATNPTTTSSSTTLITTPSLSTPSTPPIVTTTKKVTPITATVTTTKAIITTVKSLTTPSIKRKDRERVSEINTQRFKYKVITNFDQQMPMKQNSIRKEPTKGDNISLELDTVDFVSNAKSVLGRLKSFLISSVTKPPLRPEFRETQEFFYVILHPEVNHATARRMCAQRESKLFEITSYYRIIQLQHMTDLDGTKVIDLDSELWSVLIWLDIEIDEDRNVIYASHQPLYEMRDEFGTLDAPTPPTKGNCIAFDVLAIEYSEVPCSSEMYALCYREKDMEIMRRISLIENYAEKLDEIKTMENQVDVDFARVIRRQDERGQCPEPTSTLTSYLKLRDSINMIKHRKYMDVNVFFELYDDVREDIAKFASLVQEPGLMRNLGEYLKLLEPYQLVYQDTKKVICTIEKTVEITTQALTTITNPPKTTATTVTHTTPQSTPTTTVVTTQKIATTTAPAKNLTTTKPPSLTTVAITNTTEHIVYQNKFFQITFYEAIIAGTSLVVTLIAVCNFSWVAYILYKRRNRNLEEIQPSDIELTPMIERKPRVKFGTDQIENFSPYASNYSLPSPAPISKNRKDN